MSVLIKNGRIVTAVDDYHADIYIEDEKISMEDTTTLLDSYVDAVETDLDKDHIKLKLRELYTEAQNLEVV